ncbi:hypothetical protein VTL71DRAFT_11296 [Oculimacula yallundae]|uniref:Uncharacterized protein n=1 Tax=Oculimacula yallundae TaxID=86028 RepID=A0ABR4CQC7_9HELO
MAHDTYSTKAANGSTNGNATPPSVRTPAGIAEQAALAAGRVDSFMRDASSYPPYNADHPNATASRTQSAAANIDAFDMAFNNRNENNFANNSTTDYTNN